VTLIVRTKSLAGEYVHVDELDPAMDQEAPDWRRKYDRALELGEVETIPRRDGMSPVVWRFRHLSADEIAWLVDRAAALGPGSLALALDVLALALVGAAGVQTEDGKPYVLERERDARRAGFMALKREQLDMLLRDDEGRMDARRLGRLAGRVWSELNPRNG
jgi:hypothetical protein